MKSKSSRVRKSERPKAASSNGLDSPTCGLSRKQLHDLYYYMQLCRSVEEKLLALYKQGKLIGSLFRSLGQEGTAVGSAYALEPQDVLCPMIRDIAALYVRGHTPRELISNYMGKAASPTGGKDGNQHFGDLKRGTIACISMMGSVIPVVMGAAYARQAQGIKAVGLTFVGDGGTSTGDFHESLNFASVRKFPLILIVESNGWAYSTPTSMQMNIKDIVVRAQAYNIPGYMIDGNNVLEVYRTVKKAAAYAREGNGPSLIEVKTFRMRGHAEHDDAAYVPKELFEEWRKKDPIDRHVKFLKENDLLTDAEQKAILARIEKEIQDAEEFALNSPLPDPSNAVKGVFEDDSIVPFTPWWER
jgi:TPP-dependent pyruvate/acetoin dehydrogenase alpha subunit